MTAVYDSFENKQTQGGSASGTPQWSPSGVRTLSVNNVITSEIGGGYWTITTNPNSPSATLLLSYNYNTPQNFSTIDNINFPITFIGSSDAVFNLKVCSGISNCSISSNDPTTTSGDTFVYWSISNLVGNADLTQVTQMTIIVNIQQAPNTDDGLYITAGALQSSATNQNALTQLALAHNQLAHPTEHFVVFDQQSGFQWCWLIVIILLILIIYMYYKNKDTKWF